MFSLFRKKVDIDAIKRDAVEQYKRSFEGRKEIGLAEDSIRASSGECSFRFNDPEISVFSIERLSQGTTDERTVIGYYFKRDFKNAEERSPEENKKVIHQWFLVCSRENHVRLIEEWEGLSDSSKPKQTVLKG